MDATNKKTLSVFFPVYNEEKLIDRTISEILRVADAITDEYEILLINDGSTDASREKILRWSEKNQRIRLIDHDKNRGYGEALCSGFRNAKNDLIFYTDADMPAQLDEMKKLIPLMDTCDLAMGYRVNRADTPRRYVYSKIYNFLLRIFLRIRVRDANFSFKCVRREAVRKFNLTAKSVFIDGELLAEAVRNKCSIREIPVVYIPRKYGRSNFDSLRAALETAREVFGYWLKHYVSGK